MNDKTHSYSIYNKHILFNERYACIVLNKINIFKSKSLYINKQTRKKRIILKELDKKRRKKN